LIRGQDVSGLAGERARRALADAGLLPEVEEPPTQQGDLPSAFTPVEKVGAETTDVRKESVR
jgi:hypothetical protein